MEMYRTSGALVSILLMIILSSLFYFEIDFNLKNSIIDNVFAIKGPCLPEDQQCVILPEECNNNIDDDEDGKTDSEDPDCGPTTSAPPENNKPKANAGPDQTVKADAGPAQTVTSEDEVTLDASGSKGSNLIYEWERPPDLQINGWDDNDIAQVKPSFIAPTVDKPTELMFDLFVYDEKEGASGGDDAQVTITVEPKVEEPPPGNQLALVIQVEKDPINVGDKETITITAVDKTSNENVVDATISGKVTSNGYTKKFSDNDGEALYSWKIGSKTDPGKFNVIADATAEAYEPGHASKTFNVISKKEPPTNGETDGGGTDEDGRQPGRDQPSHESDITFNATLSKIKNLVSDLKQNDLSRLLTFAGLGVGAIAVTYGIYRSKKSKNKGGNVAVITRGGLE